MLGLLVAYLIGGVTFLPLVAAAVWFWFNASPSVPPPPLDEPSSSFKDVPPSDEEGSAEVPDKKIQPIEATGWIYLSQQYINVNDAGDVEAVPAAPAKNETAKNSLKKLVSVSNLQAQQREPVDPIPRSLAKLPKYWGVVRGGYLLLYADNTEKRLVSDVALNKFIVTLWPPGAEDFELFYKKLAICLVSRTGTDGLVALDMHPRDPPKRAYFLYLDNGFQKEDMYFALIKESRSIEPDESLGPRDPNSMAKPIEPTEQERRGLLSHIYSMHESPQTQWLNALLGRLFLAVKDSRQIDNYFRHKIVYKLSRTKPTYIGDIEVEAIHVGSSVPYFVDIKLQDLDAAGNLTLSAGVTYRGGFFVNLATEASISIPGMRTRTVSLMLAVTLRSLEGRIVLKVKRAPSSRIWYAFESMPKLDLLIEPVVSKRKMSYAIVTKGIQNAILDALKESMVMPYMDDISFYDTSDEFYRGGIWDARDRPSQVPWHLHEPRERTSPAGSDAESFAETRSAASSPALAPSSPQRAATSPIIPHSTTMPSLGSPGDESPAGTTTARGDLDSVSLGRDTALGAKTTKWRSWGSVLRKRPSQIPIGGDAASAASVPLAAAGSDKMLRPSATSPLLSPYGTAPSRTVSGSQQPTIGVTAATAVSAPRASGPPKDAPHRRPVGSGSSAASPTVTAKSTVSADPADKVALDALPESVWQPQLKQAGPTLAAAQSVAIARPGSTDVGLEDQPVDETTGRAFSVAASDDEGTEHDDDARDGANISRRFTVARKPVASSAASMLSNTLSENASVDRLSLGEPRHQRAGSVSSAGSRGSRPNMVPRRSVVRLATVSPEPERAPDPEGTGA